MRRLLYPVVLLLLAAGCRSTDSIEQLQSGRRSDCDVVTILAPSNNELTRTTLSKDEESGEYKIFWALEDALGVFSDNTKNAKFTLTESGGNTVAFKGTLSGVPTCAYYPYSGEAGDDPGSISMNLPATQEQTGSDPNMAYDIKSGQKSGGSAQAGYTFTFAQKLTLLRFTLTPDNSPLINDKLRSITIAAPSTKCLAGNYTLNITDDEAVPTFGQGASNQVTVKFNDKPVLNSTNAVVGYVFINPDIKENDALTITIDTDKHVVVTKTAKASSDFELGVIYEIGLDIADLVSNDKIDIMTKESWENVTAPGYYTLDNGVATAIHQYEAYKDQYVWSTSGGNYSFRIQSMVKGRLSKITVPEDANVGDIVDLTLYTIYGNDGIVETVYNNCLLVRKHRVSDSMVAWWLESQNGNNGFVIWKEDVEE